MIDRFVNFFCSLRLTIVCLACALVLVFAGTLAQVRLGLYACNRNSFAASSSIGRPPEHIGVFPSFPAVG